MAGKPAAADGRNYTIDLLRVIAALDYAILTVSAMDEDGYFSTGGTGGSVEAIVNKAKHIYLEVNENMPYLPYSPKISLEQIKGFCENNAPLPALPPGKIDDKSRKIGEVIAERIPDSAVIQLGIGGIPAAVGIAHPKFREELIFEAQKRNLLL